MGPVERYDAAGLLDGLGDEERADRVRLLSWLEGNGAELEELVAAVAEQRLALLALERRLGGQRTATEVAADTGLSRDLLITLRRLSGLPHAGPEDPVFGEADVAVARSVQRFLDAGMSMETVAELTRILGEAMSRVASAVAVAFGQTFLRPGDSELDVAERFDALAGELLPALEPVLSGTLRAHLRESVHRAMIGAGERASGRLPEATRTTVCFVDMVGFTRLGGELEVAELGSVATRLAALAADTATGEVRLIKTIGDAAMLVASEPEPLIAAALELIAAAEASELPTLRGGIAVGDAVLRGGDLFGHSVNLASRVTGSARPGTLLCTQEVRDAAPDAFRWSSAGRFRLKGIHHPVALHRARPLAN